MGRLCENCGDKLGEHSFESITECVLALEAKKQAKLRAAEFRPLSEDEDGMTSVDFRRGMRDVRLCFTVLHKDETQNEEVVVALPSESCHIQQEQEVTWVGDSLQLTGKRRARVLLWIGMESYDDFKQPELPKEVIGVHASEVGARIGPPVGAPALDDNTGFLVAPVRYSAHGRETIDRIRDVADTFFTEALEAGCAVSDAAFATYCGCTSLKYRDRAGLKGAADEDLKKADWYESMRQHVMGKGPDPRAYRAEFAPYTRPSAEGQTSLPFAKKESE